MKRRTPLEKRIDLIDHINKYLAKCTDANRRQRLESRLKSLIPKEKINRGRVRKDSTIKVVPLPKVYPCKCEYCDEMMKKPHHISGHMRHKHPEKCRSFESIPD